MCSQLLQDADASAQHKQKVSVGETHATAPFLFQLRFAV
jgi:hypothetical protein